MISINLDDSNVVENFKALNELRHTGLFSDEELQEMYNKQVETDREKQGGGLKMSKLTLEDAISHYLKVAEEEEYSAIMFKQKKEASAFLEKAIAEQAENDCKQCATDHRQIAEYLTELKELRVKVRQLEKDYEELEEINSKHMLETDNLLDMVKEDYRTIMELKKLLRLAVGDFEEVRDCLSEPYARLCGKWRYADEALKLIGDEMCGKNDND